MPEEKEHFPRLLGVSRETHDGLEVYVSLLQAWQKKINLVSRETVDSIWERHVWDSAQLACSLPDKKASITDLGSGAGLPGVVLSVLGYSNLTLVESNSKKTAFLKAVKRKLGLSYEVAESRIEDMDNREVDVIVSRALASLDLLLTYSEKFISSETRLVFLKGKGFQKEITEAEKKWVFHVETKQSITSEEGRVLILSGVRRKT